MEPIPTIVLFLDLKLGRVKCNLNALLQHLAAAAGFADNEDEGVTCASITEALRDDHLVIRRDAIAQCPEIAWAVEKADAIQAFLHSSTTGLRIPEPAPTRTGITPVNRLDFHMSEGSGKVQIAYLSFGAGAAGGAGASAAEADEDEDEADASSRTLTKRARSVCPMPNSPVHALS